MIRTTIIALALICLLPGVAYLSANAVLADERTFGGYDCTDDCSGHSAGFRWAEEKGIQFSTDCPYGNSQSFHEGCKAFTEDPYRGADEDDQGNQAGD